MSIALQDVAAREFAGLSSTAFLNHAAVSPLPARTAAALARYALQASRDPGNLWPQWSRAKDAARLAAAQLLGAEADEIAFAHSTTHGLLTVAQGLAWRPGENVVGCEQEFPANVYPWRGLAARGVALRRVAERPDRTFHLDDFAAAIDGRTRLVTVSLVNYGSGFRLPVEALAQLCHERGALLCVDGIQAIGAQPTRVGELGCDFLCADGHKWMLGPEGCGLLYVRRERLEDLGGTLTGWMGRPRLWDYDDTDQPLVPAARRFEEGSHNLAGAMALGASLSLINEIGIDAVWATIELRTAQLREGLARLGCTVVSPAGAGQRSGILAVVPPPATLPNGEEATPDRLARELAKAGVVVAARRGWLRFAPHFHNTAGQIEAALAALGRLLGR